MNTDKSQESSNQLTTGISAILRISCEPQEEPVQTTQVDDEDTYQQRLFVADAEDAAASKRLCRRLKFSVVKIPLPDDITGVDFVKPAYNGEKDCIMVTNLSSIYNLNLVDFTAKKLFKSRSSTFHNFALIGEIQILVPANIAMEATTEWKPQKPISQAQVRGDFAVLQGNQGSSCRGLGVHKFENNVYFLNLQSRVVRLEVFPNLEVKEEVVVQDLIADIALDIQGRLISLSYNGQVTYKELRSNLKKGGESFVALAIIDDKYLVASSVDRKQEPLTHSLTLLKMQTLDVLDTLCIVSQNNWESRKPEIMSHIRPMTILRTIFLICSRYFELLDIVCLIPKSSNKLIHVTTVSALQSTSEHGLIWSTDVVDGRIFISSSSWLKEIKYSIV